MLDKNFKTATLEKWVAGAGPRSDDEPEFIGDIGMKMKPKEFDRLVKIARRRLPEEVQDKNVVIAIRRHPTVERLAEMQTSPTMRFNHIANN
jgi:hypothetical protein